MHNNIPDTSSRQLIRFLRIQPDRVFDSAQLPESILWQIYCELRRRGEKDAADQHFIRSVQKLHRRRALGRVELSVDDPSPDEHKLVDDPMLSELWKAYKRCICSRRTGPAGQLLRDIEAQLKSA